MRKLPYILILMLLSIAVGLQAQIITTIAGDGIEAFSGDFGPAIQAQLASPFDVAVSEEGIIYIADRNNSRIRKIYDKGIITTIAGDGTAGFTGDGGLATSAKLGRPTSITTDSVGNVFFMDYDNARIRKIDTQGIITTIAGNGTNGYSGDGGIATQASFGIGFGIASDKYGNVFIADFNNHVVRKVDTTGIINTVAGNGSPGIAGDGGLAVDAQLNYPNWVAVDHSGNLFISDMNNNNVRKVDTDGIITRVAGDQFGTSGFDGDGGSATSALFSDPQGIAVDLAGNIYVVDNDRIRMIDVTGTIHTIAGNGTLGYSGDGGPATYANIGCRVGIEVDMNGNLYIAESYTHRVRKISNAATLDIQSSTAESQMVSVFPNPSNGLIQLKTNSVSDCELRVFDVFGKLQHVVNFNGLETPITIDLSYLAKGIYVFAFDDNNQGSIGGKLIID